MIVSPKTATQKYSCGPNRSEKSASGGVRKMRTSTPTRPPTTKPTVAAIIASSLRPCLVMR